MESEVSMRFMIAHILFLAAPLLVGACDREGCFYDGEHHALGSSWPERCNDCECDEQGVVCTDIACDGGDEIP
jgi:hypothetical protein